MPLGFLDLFWTQSHILGLGWEEGELLSRYTHWTTVTKVARAVKIASIRPTTFSGSMLMSEWLTKSTIWCVSYSLYLGCRAFKEYIEYQGFHMDWLLEQFLGHTMGAYGQYHPPLKIHFLWYIHKYVSIKPPKETFAEIWILKQSYPLEVGLLF